jgi:succinate dehydrogenase / fumarate reductase, flavoprotein subunit
MSPEWRKVNLICSLDGGRVTLRRQPVLAIRADLLALFDRAELSKYMTGEELATLGRPGNLVRGESLTGYPATPGPGA